MTITINPAAIVNAGADQTICAGATVTLAGSIGGGATSATWSGGTGTYAPNANALNAVYTPSAAERAAGTVTLTLTTNDPTGPCPAVSDQMVITINALPAAPSVINDARCGPGIVNLSASGCAGGVLNWYTASTGGTLVNTGPTYSPNIAATTSYWVSCTDANGCTGARTQVTGTINPIPAAPTSTGVARCGPGTITLTASGCTGTLKWYDAATGGTQVGNRFTIYYTKY
jgi:hypothetical protein